MMSRLYALLKRFRWWLLVTSVIVLAYGVFGFFVAPGIVRDKLVENLSAYTGSKVTVGRVSVNPFMLSVTLRNFLLPDRQGERLFSFDTLYVNFQLSSVVRGALTFGDLRLVAPYLRTLVRADGSVNLQDVLPADSAVDSAAADEPPTPILAFHVAVVGGEIAYEDRQRTTPFVARLQPINLSLQDFTTRPLEEGVYQFEAATDRGERLFWRGDISVVPVRSSGHLALNGFEARTFWSYMQDQVAYEVTGGKAYFEADYQLDMAADPQILTIRDGKARLDSVTLLDPRDSSVAATIPNVTISGLQAQALERTMRIGEIRTTGGTLAGTIGTDTVLSLTTLFEPRIDPKAPVDSGPVWKTVLERVIVEDYTLNIRDLTTNPPAQLALTPLALTLEDYRDGLPGDAKIDLRFSVEKQGQVRLTGTLPPEPSAMAVDVTVDTIPLQPFQPYVTSMGRIVIRSGTMSVAGKATYRERDTSEITTFRGNMWMENVRARDPKLREDFTRWTRLDVKNINYKSEPGLLEIGQILARGMYLRAIVGPDRVTNMQHIFAADSVEPWVQIGPLYSLKCDTTHVSFVRRGGEPAPEAAAPAASVARNDSVAASEITRIGEIRIVDGTLNFSDLSLAPNFTVSIAQLNGTIKKISSDQPASGDVDLQGKVDRYAPALIRGQVNPLSAQAYTDLTMDFQGIDLTTFTPYAGKFAGYKIDKGKLTLELRYRLNDRYLIGENHIVLDQLTLGEKVESPDATGLPVRLAVAILKDSKGVIDLDIPVKGSLDDPKFRVMPLVLKALASLFVKAVSSPFKLLGSVFGGDSGEDLSYVAFAAGSDSLAELEAAKLDTLARALIDRPGLKLDVRGATAVSVDRAALAERSVMRRLRRGDSTNTGPVTARDVDRARQLYRAQFNEDPDKLVTDTEMPRAQRDSAVAQAAVERLIERHEVTADALQTLGLRRAARIKDRLLLDSVPEARVFLLGVDTTASAQEGGVRVPLALDAP